MKEEIVWEAKMATALTRALFENKPVLIEFFNPECIGCQQLDAVTFPNKDVINFINENLIPLRVGYDTQPLAADFNIKWTPTILILDADGNEHQRIIGFLPPEQFIPTLLLGIDKMYFDNDQYDSAVVNLNKLLEKYPKSDPVPEAIYLRGVSLFKKTQDSKQLKETYEKLAAAFPGNEWTKRATPYRLL